MAEPVDAWWRRRQFTHGVETPYPIGTYREAWSAYPQLIRQYHPDLNHGVTLTQIPPAAEVLLLWQCDAGHTFAATPAEQRTRPAGRRRTSSWCPDCFALATGKPVGSGAKPRPPRRGTSLCDRTPELPPGEPFHSDCAPAPASAAEGKLRAGLEARLDYTAGCNAIRIARPFFDHLEVWPDIVIPELRIAVEYDTIGRHGLEHTGRREASDLRKDRAVRAARWEVVRIRTGRLQSLGPYDLSCNSVTKALYPRLLERFREIRGELIVNAYLRST